jgi:hypothetical protein
VALLIGFSGDGSGLLYVATLGCGIVSLLFAIGSIWPRTPRTAKDLSWLTIVQQDEGTVVRSLERVGQHEELHEIASQMKSLAAICHAKVKYTRWSIIFLVLMCAVLFLDATLVPDKIDP